MFQKAREESYLQSKSILATCIEWRKPLLIITLSAIVVGFIFSGPYFITPLYKSSVIFFPAAANSTSNALLDPSGGEKDLLSFGALEQVEQMIQILNSDNIRNSIIRKYDLMNHYEINATSPYPVTRLHKKYADHIGFHETEYASIRVDVLDADPQVAANIANDIVALADSMKSGLQRERALQALKILEDEMFGKEQAIKAKEDSLRWLSTHGMASNSQSKVWNEVYANSFSTDLDLKRQELNRIKLQYSKLKIDASQQLPHQFIIDHAVKAEKAVYPIRWLIVLVSGFCAFLLALITVIIIDRIKEKDYLL